MKFVQGAAVELRKRLKTSYRRLDAKKVVEQNLQQKALCFRRARLTQIRRVPTAQDFPRRAAYSSRRVRRHVHLVKTPSPWTKGDLSAFPPEHFGGRRRFLRESLDREVFFRKEHGKPLAFLERKEQEASFRELFDASENFQNDPLAVAAKYVFVGQLTKNHSAAPARLLWRAQEELAARRSWRRRREGDRQSPEPPPRLGLGAPGASYLVVSSEEA